MKRPDQQFMMNDNQFRPLKSANDMIAEARKRPKELLKEVDLLKK
jgi:hypothetical protein